MKKKLCIILLCLCVLGEAALPAQAMSLAKARYSLGGGEVVVYGGFCIQESEGVTQDVVIPEELGGEKITAIGGAGLGKNCTVTVPATVERIAPGAFGPGVTVKVAEGSPYFCTDEKGNLFSKDKRLLVRFGDFTAKSWTVPQGVEELAQAAFCAEGLALEELSLPESLRVIREGALMNWQLQRVALAGPLDTVEQNALGRGESLTVELEPGATRLPEGFFAQVPGRVEFLEENPAYEKAGSVVYRRLDGAAVFCDRTAAEASVREGCARVAPGAFAQCRKLRKVSLPQSLRSVGKNAFEECYNISEMPLPDGLELLEPGALGGCSSLELRSLPVSLKKVEDGAMPFAMAADLKTLALPEGLEEIGANVFSGGFERVVIPGTVKKIGEYAFCSACLREVILPDSAAEVRGDIFISEKKVVLYGGESAFWREYAESSECAFRVGRPEDYPPDYRDLYPGTPYLDIFEDPARRAIRSLYETGVMRGVGKDAFGADEPMTRAMLLTVLYRLAGEPEAAAPSDFVDARPGAYYEKAAAWAQKLGIVEGYRDRTLRPDRAVNYQEAAALCFRVYSAVKGSPALTAGPETPAGEWKPDPWARPAYEWAQGQGLLFLRDQPYIKARGVVTRSCAAEMAERLSWLLRKEELPVPSAG